jgi:hypothetical protein
VLRQSIAGTDFLDRPGAAARVALVLIEIRGVARQTESQHRRDRQESKGEAEEGNSSARHGGSES